MLGQRTVWVGEGAADKLVEIVQTASTGQVPYSGSDKTHVQYNAWKKKRTEKDSVDAGNTMSLMLSIKCADNAIHSFIRLSQGH